MKRERALIGFQNYLAFYVSFTGQSVLDFFPAQMAHRTHNSAMLPVSYGLSGHGLSHLSS
jgi:hypothetical protein